MSTENTSHEQTVEHFHPADTDRDYEISRDELTAYKMASQRGELWPTPPNPIPDEYITNAEALLIAGGEYRYDATKSPPWVTAAIAPEQRKAALDDIHKKLLSLSTIPLNNQAQELVAFLIARPEFEATGISEDGSVWARFIDGQPIIVILNIPGRPPVNSTPLANESAQGSADTVRFASHPLLQPSQPARPGVGASGGVPEKQEAFVFSSLGSDIWTPLEEVSGMLKRGGYNPHMGEKNRKMTIDDLKSIKNAGVLLVNAHGWTWNDRQESGWALKTDSESLEEQLTADLREDLRGSKPRIVRLSNPEAVRPDGTPDRRWFYAITAEFVRFYMKESFGNNSFVFINACNSDAPVARSFKEAFLDMKVVYAGWDEIEVIRCAYLRALFVFDRLLGANKIDPKESPPLRPFDYRSIKEDMSRRLDETGHPWSQCPAEGRDHPAELNFTAPPDSADGSSNNFQILAPSIRMCQVCRTDHGNVLFLHGGFGHRRDDARVMVTDSQDAGGGDECPIITWQNDDTSCFSYDQIECKYNRAGYVRVEIGRSTSNIAPVTSNVVPLTEWSGSFTYSISRPVSPPDLLVRATMEVRFACDFHKFRWGIGEPAEAKCKQQINPCASICKWCAAGTYGSGDYSYSWSGAGILPAGYPDVSNESAGFFDVTLYLGPDLGAECSIFVSLYFNWERHSTSGDVDIGVSGIPSEFGDADRFKLIMNQDYSFKEGEVSRALDQGGPWEPIDYRAYDGPLVAKLEWTRMDVRFPPDPDISG
jgi:hypothetical protein